MNFGGILLGAASFLIIGLFHPIVIKCEYYFGKKCRPFFLAAGLVFAAASLFVANIYGSVLLGLIAFSSLWSIKEIGEQEDRVKKGWFPKNPNRKYPD